MFRLAIETERNVLSATTQLIKKPVL